MLPVLQIGSVAIPVPGLALLIGVWVALWLAASRKEAIRLKLNPDTIYRLAFSGLVAGLIGARLAYVARDWNVYASDPLGVFSLNAAALAPAEGALIGVAAAFIYGARRQLPLRVTLDALAPGAALMAVAVAVAHLASGDAFGAATRLPWGVYLWGEYRHPSQIYELIAALGVLGIGWQVRAQGLPAGAGFNFLLIVAMSAAARTFLEAFRGDSVVIVGGWRAAQVWGLVVLAACLGAMRYWGRETAQGT
jgi:phosphatidylglycerol:prolipoprotein diacylglycerol transferase